MQVSVLAWSGILKPFKGPYQRFGIIIPYLRGKVVQICVFIAAQNLFCGANPNPIDIIGDTVSCHAFEMLGKLIDIHFKLGRKRTEGQIWIGVMALNVAADIRCLFLLTVFLKVPAESLKGIGNRVEQLQQAP